MDISHYCILILFLILHVSIQGDSSTDTNATTKTTTINTSIANNSEHNVSTLIACPGGQTDPPVCTICSPNHENRDNRCIEVKNEIKPARNTSRRVVLLTLICLLIVFTTVAFLVVFVRFNRQSHRRRLATANQGNNSSLSQANNINANNRFSNILRSLGLKKATSAQTETVRSDFNENLDEALLFDDPYADAGLNSSAANPYKKLTLAIT